MTLTTYVAVIDPVNPRTVLDALTEMVGGDPATVKRTQWDDERSVRLGNTAMQGLDALCWVRYSEDGPLMRDEDEDGPACCVQLAFDLPYSVAEERAPAMFAKITAWLDERGLRWLWRDDYRGDWHGPEEPYTG